MILELIGTALVSGALGFYAGYRVGCAFETARNEAFYASRAGRNVVVPRGEFREPPRNVGTYNPGPFPEGASPVLVAAAAHPTGYAIVRERDGKILHEGTDGGAARRAWEALAFDPTRSDAVAFVHNGVTRSRIGALAGPVS